MLLQYQCAFFPPRFAQTGTLLSLTSAASLYARPLRPEGEPSRLFGEGNGSSTLERVAGLQAEGPCDGGSNSDDHFENGTPNRLLHDN